MHEAPIFNQTFALAAWMLKNLEAGNPLGASLQEAVQQLLDNVTLALKNYDRSFNLENADMNLIRIRLRVRLAAEIGALSERQSLFLLKELDDIGRQLGGWQRRLHEGTR